jgi:hypothetical protein
MDPQITAQVADAAAEFLTMLRFGCVHLNLRSVIRASVCHKQLLSKVTYDQRWVTKGQVMHALETSIRWVCRRIDEMGLSSHSPRTAAHLLETSTANLYQTPPFVHGNSTLLDSAMSEPPRTTAQILARSCRMELLLYNMRLQDCRVQHKSYKHPYAAMRAIYPSSRWRDAR